MNIRIRLLTILTAVMTLSSLNILAANEDMFETPDVRDTLSLRGRPIYFDDEQRKNMDGVVEAYNHDNQTNYLPPNGYLEYHYLPNRRTLTGHRCSINKIINTVTVGGWIKNLGNLLDDDLDNYGEINAVVNADVTVGPVVSIRDKSCYYANGTTAGFCIVAGSGSTVLDLSVIQAMAIGFYRDGELVGTVAVKDGQNAGGINLSLINIPGSDETGIDITAVAPGAFDEISLDIAGGIQANVGRVLRIKYAYVGRSQQAKIKRTMPEEGLELDYIKGYNPVLLGIPFPMINSEYDNFFSDDDSKGAVLTPILGLAFMGSLEYVMKDPADPVREVYEPGSDVSFEYRVDGALQLGLGSTIQISLLDRNGKEVQNSTVEAGVLDLDVVNTGHQLVAITSKVPYSGAKIAFYGGVQLNASGITILSSSIKEKPEIRHHCPINPSAPSDVCAEQSSFQLKSNPNVSVTWTITDKPTGSNASVTPDGVVTGMYEYGTYEFTATAADGCFDTVELKVRDPEEVENYEMCGIPMVNENGEEGPYALVTDEDLARIADDEDLQGGGLITVNNIENKEYVLDYDLESYAEYSGINVASNVPVVGVKKLDGYMYDATAEPELAGKRVGFMVASDAEILNLKALQFVTIRCYDGDHEVYRHVIDESNTIAADIGGNNNTQKMRYSVGIPKEDDKGNPIKFDRIVMWTSGILSGTGGTLQIYYPFIEQLNTVCNDPLRCSSQILSAEDTYTCFDFNKMELGSAVNVAKAMNDFDNMVDGDLNTFASVANPVSLGEGVILPIRLGRTFDFRHQIGIVLDNKTFVADVNLGSWLKVKTYYNDEWTGDEFTDWNAIDVNAVGYGDKTILFLQPKSKYDEIIIEIGTVGKVLDIIKFYGLAVRSDIDGDGIPDCQDYASCNSDITIFDIGHVCVDDYIDIKAEGIPGNTYFINFGDGTPIEKRTLADGERYLELTHEVEKTGKFEASFFDGSMRMLNSRTYTVHPAETKWKTNPSNSDWNKWDNWTNGSPYCCTNVIIPSDASIYPDLAETLIEADTYCCDYIHFEPRARVNSVTNLNYSKAWTELELSANRYHLLSAPLKDMVTGDMFIPAEMKGGHSGDYFSVIDSVAAPQNRFNPTIYQRRWQSAVQDRKWSVTAGEMYRDLTELEHIEGMTTTKWSKNFNHLNYDYKTGEGFSLWVDNGDLPETIPFRFRFPKVHDLYTYFNDFTGEPIWGINESIARDTEKEGRFIYEDAENMATMKFSNKIGSKDYERTVFYGASDINIQVNAAEETNYFIFGNPFMSGIDTRKFIEENKEIISGIMTYDGNTTVSVVRSASGSFNTTSADGEIRTIAPMEAIFLIASADSDNISIRITPDILKDPETAETHMRRSAPANAVNPALRIRLRNGINSASALVVDGENPVANEALLDNEVMPQLSVIAMTSGIGYDILPASERIPLMIINASGRKAYLDFSAEDSFPAEEYHIVDIKDNQSYELDETIPIPSDMTASAGRFVIVRKTGISTIVDISKDCNNLFVETSQQGIKVKSTGRNITDVIVYDTSGAIESERHAIKTSELILPAGRGIRIINVMTEDEARPKTFKLLIP